MEVVVTRRGQTTIPAELREKYGIVEGTRLIVRDVGEGVLLVPAPSFLTYAGTGKGAGEETVKDLKRLLDELRSEDV